MALNTSELDNLVARIQKRVDNPRPILAAIGKQTADESRTAFAKERAPDGAGWPPLSPRTIAAKKRGGKSALPLKDSGWLRQSISYEVQGNSVTIGSGVQYAGYHQFGTKHIPARSFLPRVPLAPRTAQKIATAAIKLLAA